MPFELEAIPTKEDKVMKKVLVYLLIVFGLVVPTLSYGGSCSQYGNNVYCDDGTSYSRYGNQIYGSDGSSSSQYGNHTYDNRGNSWSTYGNHTYDNHEFPRLS